jgi:P-type conjugative transfer protein TrbJ
MTMIRTIFAKVFLLALAVCLLAGARLGYAGSVAGFAGATEITQIANNSELLTQTAQQAQAVAENIKQTITQIQQYATMIQNLKQLPAQLIQEALGPYQSQIADLKSIYDSVKSIQQTGSQLSGMLNGNLQDMAAMNMSPQQYLTWTLTQVVFEQSVDADFFPLGRGNRPTRNSMISFTSESSSTDCSNRTLTQSKNRQGAYAQKLQQEMQAISDMDQRYKGLQSAFNKIPDIAGQVQGMQQLTQMTGMAVGELMDLRLVVQKQQVEMTQTKAEDEASRVAAQQLRQNDRDATQSQIDWFRRSAQ